ncbi:phage tail protein [Aliikangiella coralliicola]|uniref:Phage tail protein n=1 Tax=Aliikangiella coralliicola TaxID=2592383 RepID=A0A545U7A1_9GAMM|nr:tail fiber protein [Aliikangiella coralliicola]TQV85345.1 phage tail protein [Aliikangiella coralliicola]
MSEPFIGEIRMFGGNFAPRSWAFCDGQLLAVSQNDALFSLLGTIYGGDGRTTFGLPDLRGRLPVKFGQGTGLSNYPIGRRYGDESVVLTSNQIPSHNHPLQGSKNPVDSPQAVGRVLGKQNALFYHAAETGRVANFSPNAVGNSGGSQAHNNMMPSLCVNFIISLIGTYPSRN